jgi:hypothetical protein
MKQSNESNLESTSSPDEHMVVSNETGRGYLTGPGLYEFPVDYAIVDDLAFHEGCIELDTVKKVEEEAERIRAKHTIKKTIEAAGENQAPSEAYGQMGVGLPTDSSFLWTNGLVPYTISNDVPNDNRVDDAIKHIESNTSIRFVRRTSNNARRYPNYIEIISNGNKGWSSSKVGMRGGRQLLRFSDRHSWKILVHEFLHALGMYHEQSRSDRDEYVEIRWNNIPDGPPPEGENNWTGNFQKKPDAVDYFDYDYGSIMHYGPKNFARDRSKPTIVPCQPDVTIGQRERMSYGDRQTIAKMYERFFSRGYAGVWRAGSGRYGLWVNASWASFIDKWQEWSGQGLRLHDIHVQRRGNRTLYSGVFLPGSGRYGLWANVNWSSFRNKWQEWSNRGLRLVDFHIHRSGAQNRYSGVFLPGSGGYGLWANVTWSSFRDKWREWSSQNLRLVDIHVHHFGGQTRYSGVFLPGSGGHGLWANTTWSSFTSKWREWSGQGLQLVDLNLHHFGNSIRYSGVFLPGTDSHYLWANVTFEGLRAKWEELAEQGLRLIDFEIANPEDGASAVADFSPENADDEYQREDLEEFGGIYDQEIPDDTSHKQSLLKEGGGGLCDEKSGAAGEPEGPSDMEGNGAAYFPSPMTKPTESEEGLGGGAFFDVARDNQHAEETEGYGGAVLPHHV